MSDAVTGEDWSDLRFSRVRSTTVAGAGVRVARQGLTGELGYELWVDRLDGHCVNLNKAANFVGRAALEAEHRSGPRRRLVGLRFDLESVAGLFLAAGMAPEVSPRVRWDHLPRW